MALTAAPVCPHCSAPGQAAFFCTTCSLYTPDEAGLVEKVTYNRRFWGTNLLEGVLFVVTLIIGWYIWLIFTAKTSQTPAKRLLNVYTIDIVTGQPISAGRVWVREVLVKQVLIAVVGAVIGVAWLIDALWVFFDRNRQALHDKVVGTVVVYAPRGLPESMATQPGIPTAPPTAHTRVKDTAEELRELARLRDEGILTPEEYEDKRKDLAQKI